MKAAAALAPVSKKAVWSGRVISGLVILFMFLDCGLKLAKAKAAVDGTVGLGYPAADVVVIGVILLACTILYAIPRTSVFGAILLTGYLGGAVASNVRVGNPLFSYELAPVYFGILVWLGLYLREERLRTLVPLRSSR